MTARLYRPTLTRSWSGLASRPGPLGWLMLNPSTADAIDDDPTIRKCVGFAQRAGYGSIVVANIYPMRGMPADLQQATEAERLGDDPDAGILEMLAACEDVVLAWGQPACAYPERLGHVCGLVLASNRRTFHLGVTKTFPHEYRHPSRIGYAGGLIPTPSVRVGA